MRKLALEPGERVVTAWAERASGPGWTNMPIYVLIGSNNGEYRVKTLQPEEWRGVGVVALYNVSEAAHTAMLTAVRRLIQMEV